MYIKLICKSFSLIQKNEVNKMLDILENIILGVYNAGATVFLPFVFLFVGLFFRMKFADALRAGLKAGIGLAGVSLVTNYMITTLQPTITYFAETSGGGRFSLVDIPWSIAAALPFAMPASVFLIPCFAILTVVLVRLKVFKTLQLSIWDYGQQLCVAAFGYILTGSLVFGIIIATVNFLFCLWLGDRVAKYWSTSLGLDGTTCSNVIQMSMALPLCYLVNKLLDLIPFLKDKSFSAESLQKKIGIFGEPAIIGFIVGAFMAIITKQNITSICTMAMGISASIVLIPHVIKIFLEGVGALTQAAQEWASRHLGEDSEVYIACDMAMSIGSPVVITINSLMIPVAVIIALIVPDFQYFPTGLMGGIIYMVGICAVFCKEDFVRTFICSTLYVALFMLLTNYLAPEIGNVFRYLDPTLTGSVTTPVCIEPFMIIMVLISRFFG